MQVKTIETYSLYEFCQDVQEAVIEGYRFDFDSNERFPTQFGTLMVAGMIKVEQVKQESVVQGPEQTAEAQEEKPVVKLGRKPRG
jgi:hypothetical protein